MVNRQTVDREGKTSYQRLESRLGRTEVGFEWLCRIKDIGRARWRPGKEVMRTINHGDKGIDVTHIQNAVNKRLKARSAPNRTVKPDGVFGPVTRKALVYACYLLGMSADQLEHLKQGGISPKVQVFILNPGKRTATELHTGRKRVARHRFAVRKAKEAADHANDKRKRICAEARKAAANYRKNPGAYHYLAGGAANTVYLRPTPRTWRSDCSQFAAAVYKGAGLPSPAAPLDHQWASTFSIVKSPHARFVNRADRKPGMLGMYGTRTAPHHVEIFVGDGFVGHGSPPIDSLTPGEPNYYVDFDFLN